MKVQKPRIHQMPRRSTSPANVAPSAKAPPHVPAPVESAPKQKTQVFVTLPTILDVINCSRIQGLRRVRKFRADRKTRDDVQNALRPNTGRIFNKKNLACATAVSECIMLSELRVSVLFLATRSYFKRLNLRSR